MNFADLAFFSKIDPTMTCWLPNGRGIKFVDVGMVDGQHYGILSTEDSELKDQLRHMISARIGGVEELTYPDYLELKKNLHNPVRRQREEIRNTDLHRTRQESLAKAAEAENAGKPEQPQPKEPPTKPLPSPDRPRPRKNGAKPRSVPPPPPPPKK